MSTGKSNTHLDLEALLKEISSIPDVKQFASGVSSRPEIMFDAFQHFIRSHEALKIKNNELDAAHRRVQELECISSNISKADSTNQILSRLADALSRESPSKTMLMKDGEAFSGLKKDYYPWKETILLKLKSNADHFPTEMSKLAYVYSQMNTTSKIHIQVWVKDGVLLFDSVGQMINTLETIFGDPNRVRDAVNRLHANFQRNKPFSSWIIDIRRDAAIAGYESESRPLRDLIFYNMSIELKKALVHERDIDNLNFDEAIARLQDIDNRQRSVSTLLSKNFDQKRQFTRPSPTNNPVLMANNDPMDLSLVESQHRGPLSNEEKDRRRRLGLCYYCSEKGHLLKMCPVRPQIHSRGVETSEEEINFSGKD